MKLQNSFRDYTAESALFVRRALVAFLGILLLTGVLIANLYNLQIVRFTDYQTRSNENRIKLVPIAPSRGIIYDRNGTPLALNRTIYQIEMMPEKVDNVQDTLNALRSVVDLTDDDIAAFKKDHDAMKMVGNITIMGGALTVPGNVTPVAEANIEQDPVAANEMFTSDLEITMVGLDVTLRTLLTKKETKQWRETNTEAGEKMADIVDFYIDVYDDIYPELGGCSLHDPLAVGVAIDPSFVDYLHMNIMVTTEHDAYYARTIGDKARLNDPETNVNVAVTVDKERYLKVFMDNFLTLFNKLK